MNLVRSYWRSLIILWYASELYTSRLVLELLNSYASFASLMQEARNLEDFLENFKNDPTVKIPRVYKQLSGSRVLVMEWIDGIRCTDPQV